MTSGPLSPPLLVERIDADDKADRATPNPALAHSGDESNGTPTRPASAAPASSATPHGAATARAPARAPAHPTALKSGPRRTEPTVPNTLVRAAVASTDQDAPNPAPATAAPEAIASAAVRRVMLSTTGQRARPAELSASGSTDRVDALQTASVVLITPAAELLDAVVASGYDAVQIDNFDDAQRQLHRSQIPVVILDCACVRHAAAALQQLQRVLPHAAICMCGTREQRATLMNLTVNSGPFRFIVPPYSPEQMRLALDAAMMRHAELETSGEQAPATTREPALRMPRTPGNTKYFAASGAALAVLAIATWFTVSSKDDGDSAGNVAAAVAPSTQAATPTVAGVTPAVPGAQSDQLATDGDGEASSEYSATLATAAPAPTVGPSFTTAQTPPAAAPSVAQPALPDGASPPAAPIAQRLRQAEQALAAGHITEPKADNALEHYRAVLQQEPNNVQGLAGLTKLADHTVAAAEGAVLDEQLVKARRHLDQLRRIDPNHPRLAFLDKQIVREQERLQLSVAQETGERIRALVAEASIRTSQGNLIAPPDSARDALFAARDLDPENPAVIQGLMSLSNQLALQARDALRTGDVQSAQSLLTHAQQLGIDNPDLLGVADQLRQRRTAAEQANVLASAAKEQLARGHLIAPDGANAFASLTQLRAANPKHADLEPTTHALGASLLVAAQTAVEAKNFTDAEPLLNAARQLAVPGLAKTTETLGNALAKAKAANEFKTNIVSALTLKRTREVAPAYPETANRRRLEGWVDLVFTVTKDGRVADLEIVNAEPARVFDEAATDALQRWQFEPPTHDGVAADQRARIRVTFSAPNR